MLIGGITGFLVTPVMAVVLGDWSGIILQAFAPVVEWLGLGDSGFFMVAGTIVGFLGGWVSPTIVAAVVGGLVGALYAVLLVFVFGGIFVLVAHWGNWSVAWSSLQTGIGYGIMIGGGVGVLIGGLSGNDFQE